MPIAILGALKQSHTLKSTWELSWEPGPRSSLLRVFLPQIHSWDWKMLSLEQLVTCWEQAHWVCPWHLGSPDLRETKHLPLSWSVAGPGLPRREDVLASSTIQSPHSLCLSPCRRPGSLGQRQTQEPWGSCSWFICSWLAGDSSSLNHFIIWEMKTSPLDHLDILPSLTSAFLHIQLATLPLKLTPSPSIPTSVSTQHMRLPPCNTHDFYHLLQGNFNLCLSLEYFQSSLSLISSLLTIHRLNSF